MKYCSIASGSNGNSYYVGNAKDAVLIDLGINTKHMEIRMARLGIAPQSIKAIFITHEHSDHIKGLSVFCKRYQIAVYCTEGTYKGSKLHLPEELIHIMKADAAISIGSLTITGVPKFHDAKEPCSFMVSDGEINVAVLTDIGQCCDQVKQVVNTADVLFLESNYDEEMLERGRYSYFLKNRIRSGWGHISNAMALDLFLNYRSARLKHLILGHLSGQNNTTELVLQTFEKYEEEITLSIATREQETALFDFFTIKQELLSPPLLARSAADCVTSGI